MENKKFRVLLDAGHYGNYNQSPVVPEYWESRRMWVLCKMLRAELEKFGIEVGETRPDVEKDLPVYQRGRLAVGCDLFLSLHSNAAKSEDVDRVDVYAPYDNVNNSHELAGKLGAAVAGVMGISDAFVKTRKSENGEYEFYGVLRGARAAGCPLFYIIEHSFHTNKAASLWLMDDNNLRRLAIAEAAVIAEHFGIETKYTIGDVDGDGDVDGRDYLLIKRAVMGTYELSELQEEAADVNQNGKIDPRDYLLAKRICFGTYQVPTEHEPEITSVPESTPENSDVPKTSSEIKEGDKVRLCDTAKLYVNGEPLPEWVKDAELYIRKVEENGVVLISTYKTKKEYTGRVYVTDVYKI